MFAQKMFRQTMSAIALVVFASSLAHGQPLGHAQEPPVSEMTPQELGALQSYKSARFTFVMEHYALDAAKSSELDGWMHSLFPHQKAYDDLHALTLRRRERVLTTMLTQLSGASEETKSQIATRMQDQIYAIYAAAPMSLSNVAKKTESMLTADKVDSGRASIVKKYPHVFASGAFNVDRLDRAIIPAQKIGSGMDPLAVRNASKSSAAAEARSSGAEKLAAPKAANRDVRENAAMAAPDANEPKPAVPPAPPPPHVEAKPEPSKPLIPAPPVDEWTPQIQSTMTAYGFTDEQRRTAEGILTGCTTRARTHLETNKADIEKAQKITDETTKAKMIRSLTKEVDKIYNELTSRIDSIASLEQRQKAGTPQK